MCAFKKAIFFSIILVLIICVLTFINRQLLARTNINKIQIPSNIITVVIGDSHGQTAVDPEIVPNCLNSAQPGESYFNAYYKLAWLLNNNKHIKNIIIGYSYHNISSRRDYNNTYSSKYFSLFETDVLYKYFPSEKLVIDLLRYRVGMPMMLHDDIILRYRALRGKVIVQDLPFWGSYYGSTKSNLEKDNDDYVIRTHFFNSNNEYSGTSQEMIRYLNKIAEICSSKNVKLYLLCSPLHKKYIDKLPTEAKLEYTSVLTNILNKYPSITYINYSQLLDKNEFFGNSDHVNKFGANIISRKLNLVLK